MGCHLVSFFSKSREVSVIVFKSIVWFLSDTLPSPISISGVKKTFERGPTIISLKTDNPPEKNQPTSLAL